jgi:FkbM family methyltransferase
MSTGFDRSVFMDTSEISIKIGNLLYRRFFPLYRRLYPAFKRRQDRTEIAWMRRVVRPGDQILDIGANIGFYTSLLSEWVGSTGHVHAFEPEPTNFKHLSASMDGRKNVTLVPKAVSDRSENLLIYTSPNLNVDHRTYKITNYEMAIPVQAVSIDDYVGGRFQVDLVKMDIQGYELSALRGMEKTIAANPAIIIFSEFWPHGLRQSGGSACRAYDYILSLNLQVWLPERAKLRLVTRSVMMQFRDSESDYYNVILSKQPMEA